MPVSRDFKGFSLTRFLEEIDHCNFNWIVKRLSGNDTGLTGGHQAGIYLPKRYIESAFPTITNVITVENPRVAVSECYIPNADHSIKTLTAIYYNNKFSRSVKNGRNEYRVTGWGGKTSPILDPENTGSIVIFAVQTNQEPIEAVAWVASSREEENIIESWLGVEVEPGEFYLKDSQIRKIRPSAIAFPDNWAIKFPNGQEIFSYIIESIPRNTWLKSLSELLVERRKLEFEIFSKLESDQVLPRLSIGFTTVEEFIQYSHSIANRRKSRSGTSLELNLKSIFTDENLKFEAQAVTENKKKPDFLFPSSQKYKDLSFPNKGLQMLAAKTCCKDRWRQMTTEADRISPKHLFTLQEGVSSAQLQEMADQKVELVVPSTILNCFPIDWQPKIHTLENFVKMVKTAQTQYLHN